MDYVSRVRAGEEQNHDDQILNIAARTVALATGRTSMPELGAADLWLLFLPRPSGHDTHHFWDDFGFRERVGCASPVLFDCHSIATRLPHDCQRLPTIATAYLHIKRHIPHPRDQACHMTCSTQTPIPCLFQFLGFLQWQSCGNRRQSYHFSPSCKLLRSGNRVAVVWQSLGCRIFLAKCPFEPCRQHASATDAIPLDLTAVLASACCRQNCLTHELPLIWIS